MAPHVFIFLALISAITAVRNHGKEYGSIDSAQAFEKFGSDLNSVTKFKLVPQLPLLYNHLPKAGGTFIKDVLQGVVANENYTIEHENESITSDDIKNSFIIGSTRAPCDYYLSLWAFGSMGHGAYYRKHPQLHEFYGKEPPYTNDGDLVRFSKWLNGSVGTLSARFQHSYGIEGKPAIPDNVDCWVDTANMATDLRACLEKYEKQTLKGEALIRWDQYFKYVEAPAEHEENASVHGSCREMFDDARTAMVVKADWGFMKVMGYENCCAH